MSDVVIAFNEAINAADLATLEALMTEDHRFVDPAGAEVDGRLACVEACAPTRGSTARRAGRPPWSAAGCAGGRWTTPDRPQPAA